MVNTLRRAGACLNADTRCKVFNAFLKPHILYCATVWGNIPQGEVTKMDTTIKHAARVILRSEKTELDEATLNSIGLRPFRQLMFHLNSTMIFRILANEMHKYYLCTDLIGNSSQYTTRGTDGRRFNTFKHRRMADEYGFHCQAIRDWNTLPAAITVLTNFNAFNKSTLSFLNSQI